MKSQQPHTFVPLSCGIVVPLSLEDIQKIGKLYEDTEILCRAEQAILRRFGLDLETDADWKIPALGHRRLIDILDDENLMLNIVAEYRKALMGDISENAAWDAAIRATA